MNAVEAASYPPSLPSEVSGSRSPGWWGMVFLIMTEAVLFATFIASYFYVEALSPQWPLGGIAKPDLTLPIPMTVILLSSSVPLLWAENGIRHGKQGQLRLGFALSFILGAIFLSLQLIEYSRKDFGLRTNVYGSLFFTITGFHGLHVFIGLLLNALMQVRAWLGHFNERRRLALETTAMYWHFVDVVWIFIFTSLYLSPYLLG